MTSLHLQEDLYPSRVADLPHVMSRKDPVVYSDWSEDAPISEAQFDDYAENGFLVLDNLLTEAEVSALRNESVGLRSGKVAVDEASVFTELNSGAVRSIFKVHQQNPLFGRLARDERLISVAEFLLRDQVYIHQSRLNYKPGLDGKDFYWHSDFETWHVEDGMPRMRALSMSILMTDNTPVNGPTMFMPGSHKLFVSCVGETPDDHFKKSLRKQEYGVPDEGSLKSLAEGGIAMPTGPAGTIVIFDCNIMHGSNSNITPYPRSNAFLVYNAVSNALVEPFGQKRPRPDFVAERSDFTPLEISDGHLVGTAA